MARQVKANMEESLRISMALANLNQHELADKAGVSAPHLSVISSKNICTLATLQKLADALEIRPSVLLARGEK